MESDGTRLVTWSPDKTARVWDVATGKEVARFEGHSTKILARRGPGRQPHRHGVGRQDGASVADGDRQGWTRLASHSGAVLSASWNSDGSRIVTASSDKSARVWEAATAKEVVRLEGHSAPIRSAAWSPDGSRIVTASEDKTARVWEVSTGKEVARFEGHSNKVLSAAWSPDGSAS
jgi:WD40 repeat protein